MCGIVGIRRFDGAPVSAELLSTMSGLLQHRGPDDTGCWVHDAGGSVGLGHRRLSIIDVAGSPQPMASADGNLHLAFNGEIFNYRQLRSQLTYPFRTNGDTEVLLAGFVQHGPDFVSRLHGQFAFAVVDDRDQSVTLVRDRLGVLPLYYYLDEQLLVFASEVKALLPALPRPAEVDTDSLDSYLAHRSVPAPHTLFRGVRKLPPGHRLSVTAEGRSTMHRYWSLPDASDEMDVSDAEAVRLVRGSLESAVEAALVADVPVGAYLSGGVDSSLIVALMSQLRDGEGVETFSAGFGDRRYDELPYAREVSRLLRTRHHEVTVDSADFQRMWQRLTWHRDAPISEPADVAVFRLAELARRTVKVVLSGEGSDELFAGYPKYRYARVGQAANLLPARLRPALARGVERLMPAAAARPRVAVRAMGATSEAERFRAWFSPFTESERVQLLLTDSNHKPSRRWSANGHGDVVRRMLASDLQAWLPDNLLERGDRMSMAASLELRPPFLDLDTVELAFRLPSRVKIRNGTTKWVVKEVARQLLPGQIVDRKKVGFRVPLDQWFRSDLRPMARDSLTSADSFTASVFSRSAVQRLLDHHESGRSNEEIRIWTLLCLEVWHDTFFRSEHALTRGASSWST